MPRLRIIGMANPLVWSTVCKKPQLFCEKVLSLNQTSRSWLNLAAEKGQRLGIYKVEKLDDCTCVASFVDESEPNEAYQSIEMILKTDGCLPKDLTVPAPIPKASKALIFLDLKNGLCYVYTPGVPSSEDSVIDMLEKLSKDTGLPCDPRTFVWKEDFPSEMYEVAKKSGFVPYKVEADLETVRISAIGDLDQNDHWKKIEGSLDSEMWNTIAYVQSTQRSFIFGITRRMKKFVSIPEIGEKTPAEIYADIIKIKNLFEKAVGNEVRQYLFPDQVSSLQSFMVGQDN